MTDDSFIWLSGATTDSKGGINVSKSLIPWVRHLRPAMDTYKQPRDGLIDEDKCPFNVSLVTMHRPSETMWGDEFMESLSRLVQAPANM